MAIPCAPTGDKQVQLRRGTTAENDAFTGADGELSFDTDQNRPRIHDGVTVGGFPIALLSDIVPGSSPPFVDTTNIIMGSADNTKLLRFEVDGFTAATTRTLTPQNASYTIAGLETANLFTADQSINNTIFLLTDGTASFASGVVIIDASGFIDIGGGFVILNPDGSAVFAGGALSISSTGQLAIADGTAAAPGLIMNSDANTGLFLFGADQFAISTGGVTRAVINNSGLWLGSNSIQWSNGFASAVDVILFRDGANLGQRLSPAGLGGTQYHLYNNYTDDLNWERLNMEWNANAAFLSTERLGTGSFRNLALGSEGAASVFLRTNAINRVEVNSDGKMSLTRALSTAVATLTDAATIATDAVLANHFRVTLGGNRTLGNPTNPYDGARIVYEFIQDGTGSRTITLDTKFALGTDITGVTLTTTANKRDFMTVIYNSTADKWYVVAFVKGY